MRSWILVALAAVACNDKGDDTGDAGGGGGSGGGGGGGAEFGDYIDVTDAPTGDFTGFEGGYDGNGGWLSQTVDTALQTELGLVGEVEDFQEGEPVSAATVEIWFSDEASGAPDVIMTSDDDGIVQVDAAPMCTPVTYKVSTDPELENTKDTYEAHQVYAYTKGVIQDTFNSVSTTTYRLIPGLLGVDPDPEKGIVAGTAYDIQEDPIEGAQVIVVGEDGTYPEGVVVNYFVDDFPNRDQPYTSADGLWVAINIPSGTWKVEMYVADGAGGHMLMGATTLAVEADSINISNLYTGFGDGVKYPSNCTAR